MNIDIKEIDRLKKFLYSDRDVNCDKCFDNFELHKCEDSDICQKYTPNYIFYGEKTINLVTDLFDTIEYLLKNYTLLPKNIIDISDELEPYLEKLEE